MRFRILISALLACAPASLIGQTTAAPSLSADEVIARMFTHEVQRESSAGGYTGSRQYVLDNPRFDKQARMEVRVTCAPDGTESFQVVSEQVWKSSNLLLRKILESESETSMPLERAKSRVTSDNYGFQMIDSAPLDGRLAYEIYVSRTDLGRCRRLCVGARRGRASQDHNRLDPQCAFHPRVSEER